MAICVWPVAVRRQDNGNRAFVLLGGGYVLAVVGLLCLRGLPCVILPYLDWGLLLSVTVVASLLLGRTIWHLWYYRPVHPFAAVWRDWRSIARTRGMIALPILLVYPPFMAAFMGLKCDFPLLGRYTWDPPLMWLDRSLHGGLPGQWLLPLLDRAWFIMPLDRIYAAWFLLNTIVLGWMAFSVDFALRRRFWTAFVVCWMILGTVGALTFLSAGPCFYDQVAGESPYMEQMTALRHVHETANLASIELQDMVREQVARGGRVAAASAMPSMHISMCVLFTLAGWHRSRRIGALLLAVTILTQVACVALGWHYAIDGYVAAAGTCLIWWAVGKAT